MALAARRLKTGSLRAYHDLRGEIDDAVKSIVDTGVVHALHGAVEGHQRGAAVGAMKV